MASAPAKTAKQTCFKHNCFEFCVLHHLRELGNHGLGLGAVVGGEAHLVNDEPEVSLAQELILVMDYCFTLFYFLLCV